jgi:hypothetical protein
MPKRTTPREHGTRARFVFGEWGADRAHGCRCIACRRANADYAKTRNRWVTYAADADGYRPPFVDAGPARDHLIALSAAGVGRRRVIDLSGLADTTLSNIRNGQSRRVRRETAQAILAVTVLPAGGSRIDGTDTWRLVDQLLAAGVTKRRIGQAVTGNPKCLTLQVRRGLVLQRTAERVRALHGEVFALQCSCGHAMRTSDDWRRHAEITVTRTADHRLIRRAA